MLAELGEDITVRRYSGPGPNRVKVEALARGRVLGGAGNELVGETAQTGSKVILLNDPGAAIPGGMVALSTLLPLTDRDKLFYRNAEVAIEPGGIDDDTRRINGVLIAMDILVLG